MTTDDRRLTQQQKDYFATLRRIDPSPAMEQHIQSAIRGLDPALPQPSTKRALIRGLWRGFLAGLGIRPRPRMRD